MDVLYIIIPAYNESQNIEAVIDDWYSIIEKNNGKGNSRLVVIDDGSKDDTKDVASKCKESRPLLDVLTKPNGGHGPTVMFGYDYALSKNADYIFQTDSDGQTDPNEFYSFWNNRNKYTAIFGNRTKRGDGQSRAFVEKTLCLILEHYFHVRVPDANAPFRLMTNAFLTKYLPKLPNDYNLPNAILTVLGAYYKEPIAFKEISFQPRQAGVNSINIKKIIGIGIQALKDFKEISSTL